MKVPANKIWINIFADASQTPGYDTFGVVDEIFTLNTLRCVTILPGLMLGHRHTSVVDKGMALLCGIWLITGPEIESFLAFIFSIGSFCADQGDRTAEMAFPIFLWGGA